MVDYNAALPQLAQYQAPNVLAAAEHMQKMQTSNMLMQQRAAELQKENAIRGAAAEHGFGSQKYIDAVARIDPAAAALALTQQRQAEAARASAGASAASAALSRLQGDKVTQDILAKKGDQFVMGIRSIESYAPEQQPVVYGKMYQALPDTLKPFFNPTYSQEAVIGAQRTAADVVERAKALQPQLQPQEAGMPGRTVWMPDPKGGVGSIMAVPEALPPGAVDTMMPQPGGVNNLAPGAGANFTPRPMPGVNNLVPAAAPAAAPAPAMLPSQMRAQAAAQTQAAELAQYQAKRIVDASTPTPEAGYRYNLQGGLEPIPGGPASVEGITAKLGAENAAKATAKESEVKAAKKEAGENLLRTVGGENGAKIEALIKASTSGRLQKYAAETIGATTGSATTGMQNIAKLDQLAKQMTFDLLNGKLGANISDQDRNFITGLVANIAAPETPDNERIEGFRQLKNTVEAWASGKNIEIGAPAGNTKTQPEARFTINGRSTTPSPPPLSFFDRN
jgi:hypothetical protein